MSNELKGRISRYAQRIKDSSRDSSRQCAREQHSLVGRCCREMSSTDYFCFVCFMRLIGAAQNHSTRQDGFATLAQPSTRAGPESSALGVDPTSEQRES